MIVGYFIFFFCTSLINLVIGAIIRSTILKNIGKFYRFLLIIPPISILVGFALITYGVLKVFRELVLDIIKD